LDQRVREQNAQLFSSSPPRRFIYEKGISLFFFFLPFLLFCIDIRLAYFLSSVSFFSFVSHVVSQDQRGGHCKLSLFLPLLWEFIERMERESFFLFLPFVYLQVIIPPSFSFLFPLFLVLVIGAVNPLNHFFSSPPLHQSQQIQTLFPPLLSFSLLASSETFPQFLFPF